MALKKKLTPEEKSQILSLHSQGLTGPEIADQMHIDDARQVVGVIRAAVNFRRHPSMTPGSQPAGAPMTTPPPANRNPELPASSLAPLPPEAAAPPASAQLPAPAPLPAPIATPVHAAPPAPPRPVHLSQAHVERPPVVSQPAGAGQASPDGFGNAWAPAQGHASGFNFAAPTRKYMVYRDEPQDGLLGEHVDPFSEREVATTYGGGLYRVLRFDPGNPRPFQTSFRVAPGSYGPPKFAARQSSSVERPGYGRWSSQQRPWFRGTDSPREEEGVNEPQYNDRPRSMYDFARHTPTASSSDAVAAAAIKAFGDLNSKTLDQVEQARRQGPDTFITKFFSEQQTVLRDQMEQQRKQDEQRRRDDEERLERRQRDADAEHRRRQEEEQKRHEREIEKLRIEMDAREKARDQERRALMEVEDKRLQVIREEAKMRQEALQAELQRNREEQKAREERLEKQLSEIQEQTSAQIQDHQEKLKAEMVRERELMDREQKLKEKHLDKEHELQSKILDVKQQQLESQGTNEVFTVVNNLINKFSAGLKEVVDLKKIEAMAPEAQAAAVQKGTIGMGSKEKEEPAVEPSKPTAAAAGAEAKGAGGNGQAATVSAAQQEERPMEEIVQQLVEQPFFQQVLKEWALHVRRKQDATTFVNMYLEWMRDPNDHEGRKATTMFANFISPRSWADLYKVIKPKLAPDIVQVFDTPEAAEYYETFRSLVTEQISAYWEQFALEREATKAARRAASKSSDKVEEPAKK